MITFSLFSFVVAIIFQAFEYLNIIIKLKSQPSAMPEIIRNRTIRPSSRLDTSNSYKIDTKTVESGDILIVNIDHESKPFQKTYHFEGKGVADKASISFRVIDSGTEIQITWSGASPINYLGNAKHDSKPVNNVAKSSSKSKSPQTFPLKGNDGKKSGFAPILPSGANILILGSLPGDVSITTGEYYANRGNRFWQIIASIAGMALPKTYDAKKLLLANQKIAIWDVLNSATRQGSMDHNILDESVNDVESLLRQTPTIQMIAFNGTKAEDLFLQYHKKRDVYKYNLLPSSSGANTHLSTKEMTEIWTRTLQNLK
jgi:hypoxanthine-DNA glycosylase